MNTNILRGFVGSRHLFSSLKPTVPPLHYVRSYAAPAVIKEEEASESNEYPQLPYTSRQHLPPFGWTDIQMRRNYGDPIHEHDELLSMWGPDIPPTEPRTAVVHFAVATAGLVGLFFLSKHVLLPDKPAVPREYPFSGLVTELGGLEENRARSEDETEDDQ